MNEDAIYDELFNIWVKRIKTQKYTMDAFEFERNAGTVMMQMASELTNLTWSNKGYSKFKIFNPEREINAPLYADRIAEAWITEKFIKPYVTPLVIETNMACQTGKGTKKVIEKLKFALASLFRKRKYDFWFLQFDMKGYYDNLSHDKIKDDFSGLPSDGYSLLCNVIDSWSCDTSYAALANPNGTYGVPKGCLISQWIGVLYLNGLDHLIKSQKSCVFYIRYMDDAIILMRTKNECVQMKKLIENYLKDSDMGIKLHPKKTNYAPISRGFNFCGWHYEIKPSGKILMHIRQSKKKEMISKIKRLQRDYAKRKIAWIEVQAKMHGIINYLQWGDTYHLRKYLCNRFTFQRENKIKPDITKLIKCYSSKGEYEEALVQESIALYSFNEERRLLNEEEIYSAD